MSNIALYSDVSESSCSYNYKPIYPKQLYPYEDQTKSSYFSSSWVDSKDSSLNFYCNPQKMVKCKENEENACVSCLAGQTLFDKPNNAPTAVKQTYKDEQNRRITLKFKNGQGDSSSKSIIPVTNLNPSCSSGLKRKPIETKTNFQNFSFKKNPNDTLKIKTVTFVKFDKGKFVCKRQFNCFEENQLNLPSNINKFLQSTENDDDVETDDETLNYYINKVRRQLEESVEAERLRKKIATEELERKRKIEEKENIKNQKEEKNYPLDRVKF